MCWGTAARRLSALEAAEIRAELPPLPAPLRGLDGLFDRRLDKASARRVGRPDRMGARAVPNPPSRSSTSTPSLRPPWLRLDYTWTKTTLQRAGLVSKAPRRGAHRRRRPRKPCVGMMLHQDGSRHEWLAGQAACDLIVTMDDATSEIYSAFLVEEEGTASTFREGGAEAGVHRQGDAQQPLHRPWRHYFHTPRGRRQGRQGSTHPGRPRPPSARHRHIVLFARPAAAPSAPSAPSRTASSRNWRWRGFSSQTPICPTTIGFATPPELDDSAFRPPRPGRRHPLPAHRIVDNTVRYERRVLQIPATPARHHYVKARVRVHEYPDGTLALFHGPRCLARYTANGEPIETPTRQAA